MKPLDSACGLPRGKPAAFAALLLLALPAVPWARSAPTPDDFAGTWRMQECDSTYAHPYSRCLLELRQEGDRVSGRSWYEDEYERWDCEVRGRVVDGELRMEWKGTSKNWRGTARMRLVKGGLIGTYRRADVEGIDEQYCRGSKSPEP